MSLTNENRIDNYDEQDRNSIPVTLHIKRDEENSFFGPLDTNSDAVHAEEVVPLNSGWRRQLNEVSMPEVHGSVKVPSGEGVGCLRKFASFIGPGALVAVGYMVRNLHIYIPILF